MDSSTLAVSCVSMHHASAILPTWLAALAVQAGGENLKLAVDLVAKLQDKALTDQLMQHLQQTRLQSDEAASDRSTYLVLLYIALGRHEEAAEVAVGLARSAQEAGNYKVGQHRISRLAALQEIFQAAVLK